MQKHKFKFIFDDSSSQIIDEESFRNAAIITVASRLRAKKSTTIVGAWCQENKEWNKIGQQQVVIQTS